MLLRPRLLLLLLQLLLLQLLLLLLRPWLKLLLMPRRECEDVRVILAHNLP